MRIFIIIILLSTFFSSCCKINYIDPEINNPVMDSLPYKLIWETPLFFDTTGSYSPHFPPVIIDDVVIFASNHLHDERIDYVKAYDLKTGEVKWTWSDYKIIERWTSSICNNKDYLFVSSGEEIYGIDIRTGKTMLERRTKYSTQLISNYETLLFYSESYNDSDSSSMFMYDLNKGYWKEIFKTYKKDGFSANLYPPSVEIIENNDTLLYFQNRGYKSSEYIESSELYCYNMTKDTVLWKISRVDSLVSNINNPPLIDDKHVYFLTAKTFHCYDKKTGDVVWETYFSGTNFLTSNYLLSDDKVIVCGDNGELIGVYKDSGKVAYSDDINTDALHITLYKNWVITTYRTGLDILDEDTGHTLHSWDPHRSPGEFNTGVAVDELTGYMYVSDGFFMECIEFPEK